MEFTMPRFIKYDYKQDTMLVINFEEQLQAGTFEYAIHYLINNKLDLSIFYPKLLMCDQIGISKRLVN